MMRRDPLALPARAAAGLFQPCHFGEWLQGRDGPEGPVVLVTLLPDGFGLIAQRRPGGFACAARGGQVPFRPPALRRFLARLGLPADGRHRLHLPAPPGLGTGISTASLLALARLAGYQGDPLTLARACLATEGASDPLMFAAPDRLLWASRQARLVRPLPALPRAHLLAGFWGPALPTRAADADYDDITDLIAAWRRAADLPRRAALASESAARCLARRGPAGDPTPDLARALGALGWAASHSGAARALIFAPGTLPPHGLQSLREAGLRNPRLLATGG